MAYMAAVFGSYLTPAVRPIVCNYLKSISHYRPFDLRLIEA